MGKRWWILAALFAVRIVSGIQFQMVGSLAPYLVRDLSIDYTQLGTLIGLADVPGIFLAIPGALLGRRFGDKRVVVFSLALMGCGALLMSLGGSFTVVAGGRLLGGIGSVMLNVLLTKMAIDWFAGREMATAMAILLSSWPLAISLGLVILAPLSIAMSWHITIALTALLCVASMVLVALAYSPAPVVAGADAEAVSQPRLGARVLVLIGLAAMAWQLFNAGFASLPSFGPAYLASTGFNLADAGALVSIAIWITIPSVQFGGCLADRLGRPNLIIVACSVLGGAIVVALPSMPSQVGLFIAFGLIIGVPAGSIVSLAPAILRPADRAAGMGIFYTLCYGLSVVLTSLAGWTRDATGAPAAPLYFGASELFAVVVLLALFRALEMRPLRQSISELA